MQIGSKSGAMVVAGYIPRDAEMKTVGDKGTIKTAFSVAVGKSADGRSEVLDDKLPF